MNINANFEHRAGSSQDKHEGESSLGLCDRLDRTRDNSKRQLPTDHDYAAPTREYQTDQSSLKTAPAAARSVLEKTQRQLQNIPTDFAELTRSLHIRPMRSSRSHWFEFRVDYRQLGRFFLIASICFTISVSAAASFSPSGRFISRFRFIN